MNKGILELAEQATKYADYYAMLSDNAEQEIFTKKFAELIVRECARISVEVDDTWTSQGEVSAQAFMKHFGVEE